MALLLKKCFLSTKMSGNNSVVECNLAKVDVASSNLVSRSIFAKFPLAVLVFLCLFSGQTLTDLFKTDPFDLLKV